MKQKRYENQHHWIKSKLKVQNISKHWIYLFSLICHLFFSSDQLSIIFKSQQT